MNNDESGVPGTAKPVKKATAKAHSKKTVQATSVTASGKQADTITETVKKRAPAAQSPKKADKAEPMDSASVKVPATAKVSPSKPVKSQPPKASPKKASPKPVNKDSIQPDSNKAQPSAAAMINRSTQATEPRPVLKKMLRITTSRSYRSSIQKLVNRLPHFLQLMRLDKPIGILLLLWPTLWALWLAAKGIPSIKNLIIFCLGVVVMRSAGCVINDFADRKIDGKVVRTQDRPLATGAISSREALTLFFGLCLLAFGLVLMTDPLTIKLSVGGLILAFSYPFMKRHTHLPQVVLGAAFAWGIPMAYAAETGTLDKNMWLIYLAVVLWTVVYDTFYAMVDRDDDLRIGVKSTAILFGEQDRVITGALQIMVLYALVLVGKAFNLGWMFYLGLAVAAILFIYQQWLIRSRERQACFKAFLNNNWVGAVVFVGIVGDFALRR